MNGLSQCMDKLGYRFQNEGLLRRALTHSSLAVEQHRMGEDNERLEYLGDAVLEHLVSRYLFDAYPEMREGALTRLRSSLVCEGALSAAARLLGLGDHLLLSRGEEQCGGRDKDSILSDAFEAVLAAVYLDGGLPAAREVVLRLIGDCSEDGETDAKSALQEYVQAQGRDMPTYEILGEDGPPHERLFTAAVLIDGEEKARGSGKSKKRAEQEAAAAALRILKRSRSGD